VSGAVVIISFRSSHIPVTGRIVSFQFMKVERIIAISIRRMRSSAVSACLDPLCTLTAIRSKGTYDTADLDAAFRYLGASGAGNEGMVSRCALSGHRSRLSCLDRPLGAHPHIRPRRSVPRADLRIGDHAALQIDEPQWRSSVHAGDRPSRARPIPPPLPMRFSTRTTRVLLWLIITG